MANRERRADVEYSEQHGQRPTDSLSDEWLMQAYLEGDESCFAVLIERYERELYSYLRRMTGDAALAEDVFQNTFLQVHLKRHLYDRGRAFRPWLYTIATNQAIDWMRRNQRHRRVRLESESDNGQQGSSPLDRISGPGVQPERLAEQSEWRAQVRAAVDGLSNHLRSVLVLSYYQGLKYKEIADILRIPVGTVKSRLHSAIEKLGRQWETMGVPKDS